MPPPSLWFLLVTQNWLLIFFLSAALQIPEYGSHVPTVSTCPGQQPQLIGISFPYSEALVNAVQGTSAMMEMFYICPIHYGSLRWLLSHVWLLSIGIVANVTVELYFKFYLYLNYLNFT